MCRAPMANEHGARIDEPQLSSGSPGEFGPTCVGDRSGSGVVGPGFRRRGGRGSGRGRHRACACGHRIRPITVIVVGLLLVPFLLATTVEASSGGFGWPMRPRPPLVRRFDKPVYDWLPGHRGVDLGGTAGEPVLAAGEGYVVFAGVVAGKPVVSVDHPNGVRTTYEPVVALVPLGRRVVRGDVLGTLEPGHPGCSAPCLHWGARRGHEYLNPLGLLHMAPLRLKPVLPQGR